MSDDLSIEQVEVDELDHHKHNPRIHPDSAIEKLQDSIEQFGWTNPILATEDNKVVAGHARLKAARDMGLDEVPVVHLGLDGGDVEAYMVADNRLQDETEWNTELLGDVLESLDDDLIDLTGFDEDELGEIDFVGPGEEEETGDIYTDKVDTPNYAVTGPKPMVHELYDDEKAQELLRKVKDLDVDADIKTFLKFACYRHVEFDYEAIAEYYAHSEPHIQEIFEDLYLVIIDFGKAIEEGLTTFTKDVLEGVTKDDEP